MRGIWKGMIIGAFTGAAVGILLDGLSRSANKAGELGEQAAHHAPDALEWARGVTEQAAERLRDADLPERARKLAERILESDAVDQAKQTVKEASQHGRQAVSEAAQKARDALEN